jgi:hypothetical protein
MMPNPYHQYGYSPGTTYPFQTIAQEVNPFQRDDNIRITQPEHQDANINTKQEQRSASPRDINAYREFNPLKRHASELGDTTLQPETEGDTTNIIFTHPLSLIGTNLTLQVLKGGHRPVTSR